MSGLSPLWIPVVAAYLSVAWATVFHRLWGRRRYRLASVDYWSSCGGFLTLALMLTLPLPPVRAEIDRLLGLVGLADTLANYAALLTSLAWLIYLGRLVPPGQRWLLSGHRGSWLPWRLLLALFALAVVALAGRFIWAPGQLGFRLGPHPSAARYYLAGAHLVYRAVGSMQAVLMILLLRRLAAVVGGQPALQARLRAMRWVLWYLLVYIAYEAGSVMIWQLPDLSSRVLPLRSILLLAAVIAPNSWYTAGITLYRRLAGALVGPLAAWREWRAYRRLYPLWAALYPVQPRVSLFPPPSRGAVWRFDRSLTFYLCRMVAEIHDWTIKLWPYQEPRAAAVTEEVAREANLFIRDREALVEAVALAAALRNWRSGQAAPVPAAKAQPGCMARGGATLAEEIAALVPVADAFARSPLVTAALARLGEGVPISRGPQAGSTLEGLTGAAANVAQQS
jgi:hypothetical protein